MRIRRQKICGNRVSTTNGFRAYDRSDLCIQAMIEEVRFAEDSPLEEIRFELVVPCRAVSRQGPTNCPAIIIAVDDRNYLQT